MAPISHGQLSPPQHPPGYVDGRLFSTAGRPLVVRTAFDVAAYTRRARGHIDIGEGPFELSAAAGRDLGFLWRLEASALAEVRAVLASWTAHEARVTAFIATWAYERYWMAQAIRDLLEAAGVPLTAYRQASLTARLRQACVERVLPLVAPLVGGVVREPVTAGHMARLAVQEGALQTAQQAMLPRLEGPARDVVAEVAARRDDMLEFFRTEAAARITRSPAEAVSARLHLLPPWAPLRVAGVPDPDETGALASLFDAGPDRRALEESDAMIGDLLRPPSRPSVAQARRACFCAHGRRFASSPRGRRRGI